MRKNTLYFLFTTSLFSFLFIGCETRPSMENLSSENLSVRWELKENYHDEEAQFQAAFTIKNEGETAWPDEGWALYFNRLPRSFTQGSEDALQIEHINGDFYRIVPVEGKGGIPAGDSVQILYTSAYWAIKESDAPCGLYVVVQKGEKERIEEVALDIAPMLRPEQYNRHPNDKYPYPDALHIYQANLALPPSTKENTPPFLPFPKSYELENGTALLDNSWIISYAPELESEANILAVQLENQIGLKLETQPITKNATKRILLNLGPVQVAGKNAEAYQLSVGENTINIKGSDRAGVFYGIQSLLGLLPPDAYQKQTASIELAAVDIKDSPAFPYRGMHLDVSRNFHPKKSVLKLLDLMARYKLNKFHFHLTDDEGWRLEIDGLPELTAYGAKRAHTLDEAEHLFPAYGSGPDTDSQGSGFYSKADFVEILQYAAERHIEVIPEIDMPGHARAAIKAMDHRYQKLMEAGKPDEAKEYLLREPADTSQYRSVQNYTDNVVAVCEESTYRFLAKVTEEIVKLYEEAGAPLTAIHTGGDEVPGGVWEKSPACAEWIAKNPDLSGATDLSAYFLSRFQEIIAQYGLVTAGWEEIALQKSGEDGKGPYVVNPDFVDKNLLPYVWNTVWGSGMEDLAYRLANAGYKTVMCNAPNLYFDFAYNKHPEEPGYYWAGFVDAQQAYHTVPYDVFLSAEIDAMGNPINPEEMRKNAEALTEAGKANLVGIQGQLWSETVKSPDMMEYYIAPKLLGLAQRAWEGQPDWASIADKAARKEAFDAAWGEVAHVIGKHEMPKLDYIFGGVHYRIPAPGGVVRRSILEANVAYPSLTIRYTIDGSDPDANSEIYQGPTEVRGLVKLRAFNKKGRGSRVVSLGN